MMAESVIQKQLEIDAGSTNTTTVNANSYKDITITFHRTFSKPPKVIVSMVTGSTAPGMGNLTVVSLNESTTGFTARIYNKDTEGRVPIVNWLAVAI
jgi:hypothetical protein